MQYDYPPLFVHVYLLKLFIIMEIISSFNRRADQTAYDMYQSATNNLIHYNSCACSGYHQHVYASYCMHADS